jgi:hypothetical protein
VARNAQEAREQIHPTGIAEPTYWDLPQPNTDAAVLARESGFEPKRQLWRMRRGAPIAERPDWVYALAGFEYG